MTPAKGFSTALTAGDLVIQGIPLTQLVQPFAKNYQAAQVIDNVSSAVIDIIVQRTMDGASNVTVQLADPDRQILNSGIFSFSDVLTLDGMNFCLVQWQKEGDQLQIVFEAAVVYDLRKQTGAIASTTSTDLSGFIAQLVRAVPEATLVCEQTPLIKPIALSRGGLTYPNEDSWSCMNRLATSGGWRCFESEGIIYVGSDSFLEGLNNTGTLYVPPSSPTVLSEFNTMVQDMDVDYDIGKPFGQCVVTAMMDLWPYQPGNLVSIANMGPASDVKWLVYSMERDFFEPQASIILQAPMTAAQVAAGTPTLANI